MAGLTYDGFRHLAFGTPFFGGYSSREELVYAWRQHEGIILPLWVRTFPCTRPLGWWVAEGRERKVTAPGLVREAWAGGPRFGHLHTHTLPAHQESERTYLQRHGLLTAAEKATPVADEAWALYGAGRCLWREHLADIYGDE